MKSRYVYIYGHSLQYPSLFSPMIFKLILVISLGLFFNVVQASADEKQQKHINPQIVDGQSIKFPPYPDVWDWQIPNSDRTDTGIDLKYMDNGDVMIGYHKGNIFGRYTTVSFFGRTEVKDYDAVYKGNYSTDAKLRIPFKENKILSRMGGGLRSGGCLDALLYSIVIQDASNEEILMDRTLLYVFDKPLRYETHPHCMDGPSFDFQVAAVAAAFLPLKDNTFLLVAHVQDNDYIIRFDDNFQTKSKLINKKFFWMDTQVLDAFDANYGDRAEGEKRLKNLYADLYRMLMNTKKRR